jgi:hypothetical protein
LVVPENEVATIARALIAVHGTAALAAAERATANVRRLGMDEKARWWERVAKTIREIEAAKSEGSAPIT